MKKRAICALLAVLLCVSLLPIPAMAADTVQINETNFPDPNFREYVRRFDADNSGTLSSEEIAAVTIIEVSGRSISNLTGVEHFTALTSMACIINQLTALDLRRNTALTSLSCSSNHITTLNVSQNIGLKFLDCYDNQLTSLDISRNPHLLEAYIKGEKREYSNYTRYSVSGKYLYVDPDVKIVCLSVTAQPKSQTAAAGKTATFSVKANGYELRYQWYVQKKGSTAWSKVSGGTSAKLTVKTAASMDGNKYRCQVTGAGRDETVTVTGQAAKLTVIAKPKITTQPKAASVAAGKAATFKVKAAGTGLKYQWYVMKAGTSKWAKLSGKTSASLKLTAKKNMNGNKYRCQVKNKAGSVYSKAVKLTVK